MRNGIYESLICKALQEKIEKVDKEKSLIKYAKIDNAEAPRLLSRYLSEIIEALLADERLFEKSEDQILCVNQIFNYIHQEWELDLTSSLICNKENLLAGVLNSVGVTEEQLKAKFENMYPLTGLTSSNLFTGCNTDIGIIQELNRDILSSNKIYWIVSFIKHSGLMLMYDQLKEFTSREGSELRVLTTTYMAATDVKAIAKLMQLPNTQIKVSYNTEQDRLHAKTYIFERESGFDTAYIGSSNISKPALDKGLEWNIRVTKRENPQIIEKAKATFEYFWNSKEFRDINDEGIEYFKKAIDQERDKGKKVISLNTINLQPHQKDILDRLSVERHLHNSYRNLVVAATGTGKTILSAFDYKRFREKKGSATFLFVVHREEILSKSRRSYQAVLKDPNFGELWTGRNKPSAEGDLKHLFVSIQTLNSQQAFFEKLPSSFYDYIVLDEAHHSSADSYQFLLTHFTPEILLGLTATPERMDGQSILSYFNNRIGAEIRLPEALNAGLLSPFHYYCVTDESSIDLMQITYANGGYNKNELTRLYCTHQRAELIIAKLEEYVCNTHACKALCFCTTQEHAAYMHAVFQGQGYRSEVLDARSNDQLRREVQHKLAKGLINYLFVVDLYNEGVDIPEVDTVLFLRPTESLTIFLQQLGRGLRLSENKDVLTVLDFVANANEKYNYESRFRALIGKSKSNVLDEVKKGFSLLPRGCNIIMEAKAKEHILRNIKMAIFNLNRLVSTITSFKQDSGLDLRLSSYLSYYDLDLYTLYGTSVRCWSGLKKRAGLIQYDEDQYSKILEKGLARLIQVNSIKYLSFISDLIAAGFEWNEACASEEDRIFATMFYYDIWQGQPFDSLSQGLRSMVNYAWFVDELKELVYTLKEGVDIDVEPLLLSYDTTLEINARYSREQLLVITGMRTFEKKSAIPQGGILSIKPLNTELLFVTLNKSEKDFSPSVQYKDYAINEQIFHWQSQNNASHDNNGRRYLTHRRNGLTILLFVREHKTTGKFTSSYYCLGEVEYRSSRGDFPMNIEWNLKTPMATPVRKVAEKMAVGY